MTRQEEQRGQEAAERKRIRELEALARRSEAIWGEVEAQIERKQSRPYQEAVALLKSLRDLAVYEETLSGFTARVRQIREEYARRPSLIEQLDRAGLWRPLRSTPQGSIWNPEGLGTTERNVMSRTMGALMSWTCKRDRDGEATVPLAEATGFEPAISALTGQHVRPLHHASTTTAMVPHFTPRGKSRRSSPSLRQANIQPLHRHGIDADLVRGHATEHTVLA